MRITVNGISWNINLRNSIAAYALPSVALQLCCSKFSIEITLQELEKGEDSTKRIGNEARTMRGQRVYGKSHPTQESIDLNLPAFFSVARPSFFLFPGRSNFKVATRRSPVENFLSILPATKSVPVVRKRTGSSDRCIEARERATDRARKGDKLEAELPGRA